MPLLSVVFLVAGLFVTPAPTTLAESAPLSAYTQVGAVIPAEQTSFDCGNATTNECIKKNPIVIWLNWGLSVLSAIVGVGAIIMTIVAGLQYSASRDNPQGVQAAKQKIANVVIGLAAYIFLWAFLNWLIPGGPF